MRERGLQMFNTFESDQTAQSLIANGCDNQLDVLVEAAPAVD